MPGIDALRAIAVLAVFALPRGRRLDAGRLPRRRRLLRDQRLPDHLAAARRVPARRPHPARPLLGAAGAAAAARGRRPDRGDDGRRGDRRARPHRRPARRRARLARLRRQLALHLRPPVLLRPVPAALALPPPLVALGRGAVLPLLAARLRRRDEARSAAAGCSSACSPGRSPRSPWPGSCSTPHDASRVYYGTDTHAVGLLLGVALALVWSPLDLRRGTPGRWIGPVLDAVGVLALGYVVLTFVEVHDYDLAPLPRRLPLAGAVHRDPDRRPRPPRRPPRRPARRSGRWSGSGCAATASTSGTGRCWR